MRRAGDRDVEGAQRFEHHPVDGLLMDRRRGCRSPILAIPRADPLARSRGLRRCGGCDRRLTEERFPHLGDDDPGELEPLGLVDAHDDDAFPPRVVDACRLEESSQIAGRTRRVGVDLERLQDLDDLSPSCGFAGGEPRRERPSPAVDHLHRPFHRETIPQCDRAATSILGGQTSMADRCVETHERPQGTAGEILGGQAILRVRGETERLHHERRRLGVEQRTAAATARGDASFSQRLDDRSDRLVRAHEDRDRRSARFGLESMTGDQLLGRLRRLLGEIQGRVLFGRRLEELDDRLARMIERRLVRREDLLEVRCRDGRSFAHRGEFTDPAEDPIDQIDDRRTRSPASIEPLGLEFDPAGTDHLGQAFEDAGIATAPAVDRLLHVPHHEERSRSFAVASGEDLRGERTQRPPLGGGGVLELVEEKMLERGVEPEPQFVEVLVGDTAALRIECPDEVVEFDHPTLALDRVESRHDLVDEMSKASGSTREVTKVPRLHEFLEPVENRTQHLGNGRLAVGAAPGRRPVREKRVLRQREPAAPVGDATEVDEVDHLRERLADRGLQSLAIRQERRLHRFESGDIAGRHRPVPRRGRRFVAPDQKIDHRVLDRAHDRHAPRTAPQGLERLEDLLLVARVERLSNRLPQEHEPLLAVDESTVLGQSRRRTEPPGQAREDAVEGADLQVRHRFDQPLERRGRRDVGDLGQRDPSAGDRASTRLLIEDELGRELEDAVADLPRGRSGERRGEDLPRIDAREHELEEATGQPERLARPGGRHDAPVDQDRGIDARRNARIGHHASSPESPRAWVRMKREIGSPPYGG